MKAFVLSRYGSPDDLELKHVPRPVPASGEVLVKVHAVSINDWDWGMVRGTPFYIRLLCGLREPKIGIPGVDVAGVVEAAGEDVSRFNVGDAVYGDLSESGFGAFAEYACAPESALSPMPEKMSFAEAAAMPHAAMLALQGIRKAGPLDATSRVLINGAGGGMGMIAAQLLREKGVTDIAGADLAEKFAMMQSIGVQHCIDYTREDFTRRGDRYDFILDARSTRGVRDCLRALAPGGVYVTVGGDTSSLLQTALLSPIARIFSGKKASVLALNPNDGMDEINRLYEAGLIKPVIDGPFAFEDLPAAIARFGSGKHLGKVVVQTSSKA